MNEHSRQQLPKNININIITSIRTVPSTSIRTAPSTSGTNSRSLVSWNPISRATSSRVPPSAPGWASHPPSWRGPSGALFWECLETSLDGRRETRNRNPRGWEPGNLEFPAFIPQQRKLMGSSAQNSSGVHWCRRPVRFNEVPEKVPKVPEKVWEASVQSQVRFNRVSEKVPEEVGEALVQSQVRFNRVPEKGSGEGSGEGQGGFGAARSSSTGFRRRLQRLASQHASERFVKIKFCGCWG